MTAKQSQEYPFHQGCKKTSTHTVMASRFWLAATIARLFDSHFSIASSFQMTVESNYVIVIATLSEWL